MIEAIIKRFQEAGFTVSPMLRIDKAVGNEIAMIYWQISSMDLTQMHAEALFAGADRRIWELNQAVDAKEYARWMAGAGAGEDPQMVIQMFKKQMEEAPNMMVDASVEPTFRGIPIRWIRQALRDANTKAGEG